MYLCNRFLLYYVSDTVLEYQLGIAINLTEPIQASFDKRICLLDRKAYTFYFRLVLSTVISSTYLAFRCCYWQTTFISLLLWFSKLVTRVIYNVTFSTMYLVLWGRWRVVYDRAALFGDLLSPASLYLGDGLINKYRHSHASGGTTLNLWEIYVYNEREQNVSECWGDILVFYMFITISTCQLLLYSSYKQKEPIVSLLTISSMHVI